MYFKNIIGQASAKAKLIGMFSDNRIPHALMFSGPEGSGNLPAAFSFIQYLFCTQKSEIDSCGHCPSCLKISKLSHPDFHLVFPIAKSKDILTSNNLLPEFRKCFLNNPYLTLHEWFNEIEAENKQPIIPTEEAGSILKKLSYTSYEGGYKVMLIWQPEKMNAESANKLLKILEEPPEKTIFILVCNHPDQLLSTIISRVQQIFFNKLDDESIIKGLVEEFNCTKEAAQQIALMCDGNYREAQLLLQQHDDEHNLLQNFRAFMIIALNFDAIKAVSWIDENARTGREKQKQFFQYGLEIIRECLMYNYGSVDLIRISGEEKNFIRKFSKFINKNNYEKITTELNNSFYYIERHANPKILLMDLLMNMNEYIHLKE